MSTSDTPDFIKRFRERMIEDDRSQSKSPRRIQTRTSIHRGNEVGRGGLGIVYSYYDNTLKRQVAVKVANKRVLHNEEKLHRFEREYRLTAQLQHPGVPAIYSSGILEDGRPYYVMRLLAGRPLTDLIHEVHSNPGTRFQNSNSAFQQLIESLLTCCEAVSFAHKSGILHRDIKPENIVIESDGTTFVIDWGMAAVRDSLAVGAPTPLPSKSVVSPSPPPLIFSQTQIGRFMGTPAYMSPEQAKGDPQDHDDKTDVYGLGATLFHILTGHPPHSFSVDSTAGKSPNSSWRDALQKSAQPDRHRFPLDAPQELVSICRKAMSAAKCERYENVKMMANDLRCWQRHEVVEAHRPFYRPADRIGLFLQKHRRWVASATVVLVGLTLISLVSTYLVNAARRNEIAQLHREQTANDLLLSDMEEWSEFVMQDEFLAAESFQPLRLQMLDKLLNHYQSWVTENSNRSEASMARAVRGLIQLARIHDQSGRVDTALHTYEQAMEQAKILPREIFADGTLEILEKEYALVQQTLGDSEQAESRIRKVLKELPSRNYLENREALQADLLHTAAGIRIGAADGQSSSQTRIQFYLNGLSDFEKELAIWEALETKQPTFSNLMGRAAALNGKALCLHKAVDAGMAVKTYEAALAILDKMQRDFPEEELQKKVSLRRASLLMNMGMSHLVLHDLTAGENAYRTAISIYDELQRSSPLVLRYREELARGWGNLADLYFDLDGNEKEIHARRQVIDISKALRKEHPGVGVHAAREVLHTVRLCNCFHVNDRDREAAELFAKLLQDFPTPEDVEHLNQNQRLTCILGYVLVAGQLANGSLPPISGIPDQVELLQKATALLLKIPLDAFTKYPPLVVRFVKDPAFEAIRSLDNEEVQTLLRTLSQLKI